LDNNRAEATFRMVFHDFSKFIATNGSRENKEACIVRNLPWRILIISKLVNSQHFIGYFLKCNKRKESVNWFVRVAAELRIVHVKDPKKNFVKRIQRLFCSKESDWGFSPFISKKDLLDPSFGLYDKKKDQVTFEVWLNAQEPSKIEAI
jgi:ubiquitin carboxyl-terminal hydrolase 7